MAFGLVLAGLGVIENLSGPLAVATLAGGTQRIPGGLVASWESIKLLSGDGGGFFNASSAHPFENPTPLANLVEIVAMLIVPTACIRGPAFTALTLGTALVLVFLTFLPVLSLGPLAEGLR